MVLFSNDREMYRGHPAEEASLRGRDSVLRETLTAPESEVLYTHVVVLPTYVWTWRV